MCGRFALLILGNSVAEIFGAPAPRDAAPRHNIAPSQAVLAVRAAQGGRSREVAALRWGLVPPWAKDPSIGDRLINARAETVAQKPAFRNAFRRRRCLIPASGFYEWKRTGGRKQPYFVRRRDGELLAFAGLWERWEPEGAPPLETCAIVTTQANELLEPVHDRMPVILDPPGREAWLDPEAAPGRLSDLLVPCPPGDLEAYPVAPLVNNPRIDDPRLVVPLR